MKIISEPLFRQDEDWYYFDAEDCILKLTDEGKRHPEVVESYKQYYDELNSRNTPTN